MIKTTIQTFLAKFYEAVIVILAAFSLAVVLFAGFKTWQADHYKTKFEGAEAGYQVKLSEEKQQHINDLAKIQAEQIKAMGDIQNAVNAAGINFETMRIEYSKFTEQINRELQTVIADPSYRNNCFNANGVQLANKAKNDSGNAKPP